MLSRNRKLERSISETPRSSAFRQGRPLRSSLYRAKERPRFASLHFLKSHQHMMSDSNNQIALMGDTCLEDQYLEDLTKLVVKLLQLKRQGSLLSFGGRHWKFGKLIAKQCSAKNLVYADDHLESLREAEADEDDEILTVECHLNDTNQLIQLGKYDGILMKECLERVHDLDTLFTSLYKIMKLASKCVIIARLKPNFPLPPRIEERWKTACPEMEIIKSTAERHEFLVEEQSCKFPVRIEKSIWEQVLKEKSLPFTSDLRDEEIDQYLGTMKDDEFEFDDEIHLITLIKEIVDD